MMNQPWTRRQTLWMLVGTVGGLALHACTPTGDSLSSETTPDKSAAIGLYTWVGLTPLYIAQQQGYFEQQGLNLEIEVLNASNDGNTAFISNRIDLFGIGVHGSVALATAGKDFRIVLVQDTSVGADGILARNNIKDLADFKGERIAVEEGGVSHFFLMQVLNTVGLTADDFTLVNASGDTAAAAYQSGNISIAVTYEPYLQQANAAQSDGRIIYTSAKMPTEIIDLYVVDTEYAEKYPANVTAFVSGVLQGLEFLNSNPDEAIAIASPAMGIPSEELKSGLQGVRLPDLQTNIEMLSNPQSDIYLLKTMNNLAEFLQAQNQIDGVPDLSPFIEPKFVLSLQ